MQQERSHSDWPIGSTEDPSSVTAHAGHRRRLPTCLRVLTASEQKVLGGEWVAGTKLSGLPTVRTVVNAVIQQAYDLDDKAVIFERNDILKVDHWQYFHDQKSIRLGKQYPVHALVSVDGIDAVNDVTDYMNKCFELDRARYPKNHGWTAIAAHSRSSSPLSHNHPFFRYRNTRHLDSTCSRFLVVDNMAVEGLNNRYLAIWGAADLIGSVREAVQRIGRVLRSTACRDGEFFYVPPASHDRVYLITHEALVSKPNALGQFVSTAETIADAVDFLTDMYVATEQIMSIDEYVVMDAPSIDMRDFERSAQLNRWGRFHIAQAIGEVLLSGGTPKPAEMVRRFGGAGKLRRSYVRSYAESLIAGMPTTFREIRNGELVDVEINAVEDIKKRLLRMQPPDPTEVLEAERAAVHVMNADQARQWLSQSTWGVFMRNKWTNEEDPQWLEQINELYRTIAGRFDEHEFDIRQTPSARMASIAEQVVDQLGVDDDTGLRVRDLVYEGSLHYLQRLGMPSREDFDVGGRYCRPEVTFALRNELFVSQLETWICYKLLIEHRLSKIAAAIHFERAWLRNRST